MKKLISIGFVMLHSNIFWAQTEKLQLQDAIRIGVENNYSIIIAENNEAANKYARNIGNAGMLPTISIGGSAGYSNTNVRQEQANGNLITSDAAVSTTYSAAAQLSWTLFDGLKMFATYSRLTEIKNQSEIQTRLQVETTISRIMLAYYDVVKNEKIYHSILESISIGEERIKVAQTRFTTGAGSKPELLQSKIDVNNLRSGLLNQKMLLLESKTNLNQLIARDPATEFEVEDSIPTGNLLALNDVRNESAKNNNLLLSAQMDININKYYKREVNSLRFPQLTFNAAYSFNRAQNQAGFLLLNQNFGFSTGITLSMNLFDSWRVNTQNKIAKYNIESAQLNYNMLKLQTDAAVVTAYNKYILCNEQAKMMQENMVMAKENVDLSLARFKEGISNFLELREAQLSYVDAVTAYATALYNTKVQEIELLRLKGELIK